MRRPTVTAALVLLMLLTLFSHGNPVQAQVTCTGHARHLGWSYYGTAGDDLINCRGSITDVVILGLGGKDILIGGQGNDTILGGPGEDFIFGRGGRDFLNGGSERDLLFGSDGGDILVGGLGRDSLIGSKGKGTTPCSEAREWTFAMDRKAPTTSRRPIAKALATSREEVKILLSGKPAMEIHRRF